MTTMPARLPELPETPMALELGWREMGKLAD
jgi:hypothetical protein